MWVTWIQKIVLCEMQFDVDGIIWIPISFQMELILQGIQDRFQAMSDQIMSRLDEVSLRVDDLGRSLSDIMMEAGVEVPPHLKDV